MARARPRRLVRSWAKSVVWAKEGTPTSAPERRRIGSMNERPSLPEVEEV